MEKIYLDDPRIMKFTFDTYTVEDRNRVAHACALAVAEQPGDRYNPYVLVGQSGSGKTHLVCAIGQYMLKKDTNRKVLYFSLDQFVDDIDSLHKNDNGIHTISEFEDYFEGANVVILEDIQKLGNNKIAQKEMQEVLEKMYEKKKQIIITSDRLPQHLEFDNGIKAILNAGLIVSV